MDNFLWKHALLVLIEEETENWKGPIIQDKLETLVKITI